MSNILQVSIKEYLYTKINELKNYIYNYDNEYAYKSHFTKSCFQIHHKWRLYHKIKTNTYTNIRERDRKN